jgi:hypothetical protein
MRVDVSMDPPSDPELALDIDVDPPPPGPRPTKALKKYLETAHVSYKEVKENFPDQVDYLDPFDGEAYPPNILSPDDIDAYLSEIDKRVGLEPLPTLAQVARDAGQPPPPNWDVALKNLTGGYNWLRKYAPKTFLQDGEGTAAATTAGGGEVPDEADGDGKHTTTTGRKSRAGRGERGGKAPGGGRTKRASLAHARAEKPDNDVSMEEDPDYPNNSNNNGAAASTPGPPTGGGGRGKRKRDDDPGYRPKGGSSSRPTKKKRKSVDADPVATPTASSRKPKREKAEAASADKEREREREKERERGPVTKDD